ncbi:MAG: hypothetical protein ACXWWU_00320 [Candidatus Limnocylindria bacterium]
MTSTGGWLRNAVAAWGAAIDRPDLWVPASLGAIAYLAWVPLVLTVAALPSAGDLAFLGARLLSSSAFPWNVLVLAALATLAVLIACLLAGLAEAALLRVAGHGTPNRSLTRETEAAFSVLLIASLPAVAIATMLVSGIAAVGPAEYGAPDIGGPLLLRIIRHLVPLLVALAAFAVIGQAFGAVALRRAVGEGAVPVGVALRAALGDLVTRPVRRLGTAAASMLVDLLALALATALLHVLWAPIRVELGAGQLISPQALLLLVGFVAVWLALVLAFGALHAWVSAWWSLELGLAGEAGRSTTQEANP